MSEEHVIDLLAAFALGILEQDETRLVSEHLKKCSICQREYATFSETVAFMAVNEAQHKPASELKEKVLQKVVQVNRIQPVRISASVSEKKSLMDYLRYFLQRPASLAFGVLTLLIIFFLSVNIIALRQQVQALQTQVSSNYMQVVRLEGTDLAPQAGGYVMVFEDEKYGSLAVTHAPLLADDQQYQIWLIRDGVRTSGGVFSVNEDGYGNLMVSAEQPLGSFQSFGITIEPAGGSPQPTGDKILGGDL